MAEGGDHGTLDGSTGLRLDGIDVVDLSGGSVSGAGDVNGDGIDGEIAAGTADGNGDATVTASTISTGTHTISVVNLNAQGTSSPLSATLEITVDGQAPSLTGAATPSVATARTS